ncbi:MAG: hypothetical protein ACI9VO_002084, partial [Colwellia sp.]
FVGSFVTRYTKANFRYRIKVNINLANFED